MKKCPFCFEKIEYMAKKCRYCSEWLNSSKFEEDVEKTEKFFVKKWSSQVKINYIFLGKVGKVVLIVLFILIFKWLFSYLGSVSIKNEGSILYKENQFHDSVEKLTNAISKRQSVINYLNRCSVYIELNKIDLALVDCNNAYSKLKSSSTNDEKTYTYINYSHALILSGDLEKGKKILDEAVSSGIEDGLLVETYGLYYLEVGEYNKAIDFFKRWINSGNDENRLAITYSNIAIAYIELGDFVNAKIYLDKGIKQDKNESAIISNYGYYYLIKGDFVKSGEYYMKAYNIDKDTPLVLSSLGFLSMINYDYIQANIYIDETLLRGDKNKQTILLNSLIKSWNTSDENIKNKHRKVLSELFNLNITNIDVFVANIFIQLLFDLEGSTDENQVCKSMIISANRRMAENKDYLLALKLKMYCIAIIDEYSKNDLDAISTKISLLDSNYDYESEMEIIDEAISKTTTLFESL